MLIATLAEAVSAFRRGAKALKAENSALRADNEQLRDGRRFSARAGGHLDDGELVEVVIALDMRAPGAARTVVAECLRGQVVTSDLHNAQLLVTELVANSLKHSGAPVDGQVVVSVELRRDWFRVGVQDAGSDALIAARPANFETGGGFGLSLVQMLSERWGVERLSRGGTQVWAQLLRSPLAGATDAGANGSRRYATRTA